MSNAITTLVGEELADGYKWWGTMAAPNGSLYGIPCNTGRVLKFNPVDKSITHIGPDFGNGHWWYRGAMTISGIIYCPPCDFDDHGIRKIDTNTNTVTVLNRNLLFLPEQDTDMMWMSCAAAIDGCVYFMPSNACRIMKLDPNNNDAMSIVGDDLRNEEGMTYVGTVVGIDGCVYGIPYFSSLIIRYNPINDTTSFVGEEIDCYFLCTGNGALGRDGCIYALAENARVLKIDTINNSHEFVVNRTSTELDYDDFQEVGHDAILGIDGCIYWPPYRAKRTLKYDPYTNQISLVGCDFVSKDRKWSSGALASDGVIYSIPTGAKQVLAIDPWGEFSETTNSNMEDHPEKFGLLFHINEVVGGSALSLTNFDHAVVKFGQRKVFEVLEKAMKPVNVYCQEHNLCPFMIVASYKETSTLSVINHLLRRDLSWVDNCRCSLEGNALLNKKRKHNSLK